MLMSYLTWLGSNMCSSASSGGPLSCGSLEIYCTWTTPRSFAKLVLCFSVNQTTASLLRSQLFQLFIYIFPQENTSSKQVFLTISHASSLRTQGVKQHTLFLLHPAQLLQFCSSGSSLNCTWATRMTSLDLRKVAVVEWNSIKDTQGRTKSRTPLSWLHKILNSQKE